MPLRELTNLGQIKQGLGYTPTPELDYAQIITPSASIAATTEATAGAVITGNSIYCDGSRVKVEALLLAAPSGNLTVTFVLLRDSVVIGQSKVATGAASLFLPISFVAFDSPSPGFHVYSVKAFVSTGTVTVQAGPGGSGQLAPSWLRVTRDPPLITNFVPVPSQAGSQYTLLRKTTPKQIINSVGEADLLNGEFNIPGGVIGASGMLRLIAWGDMLNNNGLASQIQWRVKFGGSVLFDTNTSAQTWIQSASRKAWRILVEILNLGAVNSQWATIVVHPGQLGNATNPSAWVAGEGGYSATGTAGSSNSSYLGIGGNAGTVDTSLAKLLELTAVLPVAGANCDVILKGALAQIA